MAVSVYTAAELDATVTYKSHATHAAASSSLGTCSRSLPPPSAVLSSRACAVWEALRSPTVAVPALRALDLAPPAWAPLSRQPLEVYVTVVDAGNRWMWKKLWCR